MNTLTEVENVIKAFNEDRNGDWHGLVEYATLCALLNIAQSLEKIASDIGSGT